MTMDNRILRLLEFDRIRDKLAQLTVTPGGRELMGVMAPCDDIDAVLELQREMTEAVEYVFRYGYPPMAGINDIRTALRRLGLGASLSPGELLHIAGVLRACSSLKDHSEKNSSSGNNIISDLISGLYSNKRYEQRISASIISEEEISDAASEKLRTIRRRIRSLQETIRIKLEETIRSGSAQKYIQEPIVTIRNDRYVIPVKQEFRSEIPGLVHDFSSSGATVYIEPLAAVEANNEIKRLLFSEQAEIERLLKEMSDEARDMLPQLQQDAVLLAKLDFLLAKARYCIDLKCMPPAVGIDCRIQIKKGRHPLIDQSVVVPIDFCIGDDYNTVVITGPNTGGKTVSLKTIGLFVLMTQAGLHIPCADGTAIRFFKAVYADIGDEQSIEQSLSTFSSHMKNIIDILNDSDDQSLVLLDELGAGTDPAEGSALGMAILDELRVRRSFVIATTHSTEIKLYAISTEGVENACCEFDIETLRPTFRILTGIPGKSNAFAISQRLGLDGSVVSKAREYMNKENIRFEDILMTMEKDRSLIESNRMETDKSRIAAEKLLGEMEEQKRKINVQKDNILREAREEARRMLDETRGDVSDLSKEIRRIRKQIPTDIIQLTPEALSNALADAAALDARASAGLSAVEGQLAVNTLQRQVSVLDSGTYEKDPPVSLKVGDAVRILSFGADGSVLQSPDENGGEAVIQAGNIKIRSPLSNLRIIKAGSRSLKKPPVEPESYHHISKTLSISPEIMVRGFTLADAIDATDKYLDDACLSGLTQVTVIHGKGTGTLKAGIWELLKNHPHVRSFRPGRYGEGDAGVTVVELK